MVTEHLQPRRLDGGKDLICRSPGSQSSGRLRGGGVDEGDNGLRSRLEEGRSGRAYDREGIHGKGVRLRRAKRVAEGIVWKG